MATTVNSEMPSNALVASGASTSLTFSFTNTSGTMLVVHAQCTTTTGAGAISSVTYGGVACTQRVNTQWDTNATPNSRIAFYTLASPATGANNVVITNSVTLHDIIGGAISVTGESGTIGVTNTGFNDSGSSSHSLSLAGTTSGSLCLFSAGCGTSISTRSLTLSGALNVSTATAGDNATMDRSAGTGGTVTDNWTASGSDLWGSAAIEILASGGGGGGARPNPLLLLGVGLILPITMLAGSQEPMGRRTLAKVLGSVLCKNVKLFISAVVLLVLPCLGHATVFWTEDFENHLWTGSNGNPWDTSACSGSPQDGCNGSISTDIAHSGTHSFKGDYTCPGSEDGLTPCGTFYDRSHTPTTEVYTRVYYYTVGFTYSPVETKHWFHKAFNTTSDVLADNWSSERNIGMSTEQQIIGTGAPCKPGDSACIYAENVGSVSLNDGQWYCIETHFKSNTVGNSDGVVEVWVDGVQTVNYTGRSIFSTPPNFEVFRIYVQSGHGLMYYDDLAVGDTRIGCAGGGGGGSTAGGGLDF